MTPPGARRKTHRRYWLWRVWAVAGFVAGPVGAIGTIAGVPDLPDVRVAAPVILLGFPALVLFFGLGAFRFAHSVFGAFEPTSLPFGPPAYQFPFSWGRVGWTNGTIPFLSWYVFPEGLGFALFGLWEGFVPRELIRSVTGRRGRARIEHDSPEVRGPIFVPARVADALEGREPPPIAAAPRRRNILGLGFLAAVPVFMIAIFTAGGALERKRTAVREEVRGLLRAAGAGAEVTVDGAPFAESEALLEALLGLDDVRTYDKSHPCRRFAVVIRGNGVTVDLDLARDSKRPDEYCVFFPERSSTDYNEVGRIRTPLLDAVPSSGKDKPRRERAR